MSESFSERLAAATGIGFVVLFFVGQGLEPHEDTFKGTADFVSAHQSQVKIAGFVTAVALLFFLWFLGSLRSYLRQEEAGLGRLSSLVFGGGLLGVAIAGMAAALRTGFAYDIGHLQNAAGRALDDATGSMTFFLFWFPIAVLVEGTSILAIRRKAFAKIWGWVGILFSLLFLATPLVEIYTTPDVVPTFPVGLVSLILFLVWVLVTSIMLIGKVGRVQPSSA